MAASTNELVKDVLENADKQYKSIDVKKDIELNIDSGNMLVSDPNPLNVKEYRSNKTEFLKSLARDNTQLLFNEVWKLPIHRVDDVIVAELPEPSTRIPREKPVPKSRAATKWEEYARIKGIKKRKKDHMVFDDEQQEWIPRYGYKSKNDTKKDWLIEIPNNADPYQDFFAKKKTEKKERVAKNELQRLKNIARAQKLKEPGTGLQPTLTPSKLEVNKALHVAKKATASIGRFEDKLPKEPRDISGGKRKRKFEPVFGHLEKEKEREKQILKNVLRGKPRIDLSKGIGKELATGELVKEERQNRKKGTGKGSHRALPKFVTKNRNKRGKKGSYR